ncbi:MAG: hypothetical protein M3041_00910 [Acidobacteriota bacterium]|nr:hypothetical protein [Acidobacteriota bacterium]
MLIRALRCIAGAAAGFLFWWYATPIYNDAIGAAAVQILQMDKRLCGPRADVVDRNLFVRPRLCLVPTATIPADQLTYSVILLGALFAMGGRSVLAFIVSCLIVVTTHVLSFAVSIESTYANANGPWSEQHYSAIERQLWISTEFFWRLVGMFAIVFACWWIAQTNRRPAK